MINRALSHLLELGQILQSFIPLIMSLIHCVTGEGYFILCSSDDYDRSSVFLGQSCIHRSELLLDLLKLDLQSVGLPLSLFEIITAFLEALEVHH